MLLSNFKNFYDTSGGHIAGDRARKRLSFVSFFFDKIPKSTSSSSKDSEGGMDINPTFLINMSKATTLRNFPTREYTSVRCQKDLERTFWILFGAQGLIIFFGNIITVIVFLSNKKLRRSYMNIFLVSLGFADILMALLVIPGHAIFCTGCQYIITKHCWFIGGTRFVVFPATKFNLLAITYDRYLAVLRPLQYQVKMTGKRVISILLLAWTLPIVLAVLRNAWQHTSSPEKSLYVDRIYSTVLIFAFVVVPVVLMVIVNILIVQAIRRQRRAEDNRAKLLRRNRGTCYIGHKENWNERRLKHKGTVSCILIVLIFVVCWIPRAFYNFSHVFGRPDLVSPLLEKLSLFFLFLQSAVNPAIYSYYRDDFKKALLDLLSRT